MSAPPVLDRGNFWFSPSGRRLACLAGLGESRFWAEAWNLDSPPTWRPIAGDTGETGYTQPLALDDGRVLLARPVNGQHRVVLCPVEGPRQTLETVNALGLRLIVSRTPDALAFAVITRPDYQCELWRVRDEEPALTMVARLPGLVPSNEWLDASGRTLGFSCLAEGEIRPLMVDTVTGVITAIPGLAVGMRPLLHAPASGLLVVGRLREFGWTRYGHDEPVVFPAALRFDRGNEAWPLAADPAGQRLLLLVEESTRSRLVIYYPFTDRVEALDTPVGVVGRVAQWRVEPDGTDIVHFPFSGPARSAGLAELVVGGGCTVYGSVPVGNGGTAPHTELFPGPAGPIEAVVWGSWRRGQDVLIALHGGPVGNWRLDHDPELQRLADAGLAIIAPNVRGGGGDGPRDPDTGRGAWGGPDLADLRHLARAVVRVTGTPLRVLGRSYGAYLALLAVGADPRLWSHCAALAPFVSAASLHAEAGPRVRALIERLDGLAGIDDELGPRDSRMFAARSTAQLFLAHGSADAVIPITQFHALREHLIQHRTLPGPDPILLEVDGADHDLADYDFTSQVRAAPDVSERLFDFLTDGLARPATRVASP